MKNVLLLVHDDPGQEARLQAALDLTRALSGHLHCVDVTPLPLMADAIWGAAQGPILYDESEREQDNVTKLKTRLTAEDVAWTCDELRGDYVSCLRAAVRTADVVVLNRGVGKFPSPDMRLVVGELVDKSDALVLAVTDDCRFLDVSGRAMIAWDGSETAMRAVQRAVPLLTRAHSVTIFQAGVLPEEAIPASDVATYLARHEIKPEIEVSDDRKVPAAQISRAAGRHGAAFCVMGAYGHSRLREAVFGGVTQELLGSEGIPLLLGR